MRARDPGASNKIPMSMRSHLLASCVLSVAVALSLAASAAGNGPEWSRFRGPNGSGVAPVRSVPTEFGPAKNLLWRLPLPPGHSSPVLYGERVYLTAFRERTLLTLAIDRNSGRIVWERPAPLVPTKVVDKRNNPASPSPAVDDSGVYVFFPDYGLVAYDPSGRERWKMPLGPFNNIYGMGASPIVVGDLVVLACDQSVGSYLLAADKRSGRVRWKTERPEAKSGHSTPIVWRAPGGGEQILLPGSFLLTAYDAASGRKLWWVRGLSFEMKSTPVIGGDTIYVNGYGAPVNDPGNKVNVPPAEQVWKAADADRNGVLSKPEFPKFTPAFWFDVADLDTNGSLTHDEWSYYRAALDSENGMLAIRLGGSGDVTETAIRWKYQRSVPQLPSPLLYGGVLYMVNDNGIVTLLDPETGSLIKQGRLTGAPGAVFASPIAAADRIFFATEDGAVAVVAPGQDLAVTAVNDLGEDTYATPAVAEGRIYVRTTAALYAFGEAARPR
jgi:outer membrane protein assembly factor BamB